MFRHFLVAIVLAATSVVRANTLITLQNDCSFGVGMFVSSFPGSNNGINYSGNPSIVINAGQSTSITVPTGWSGRICDMPPGSGCENNCFGGIAFGEAACSMTEWTMDSGGLDFYDISNIQGFSVEMNIIPSNGGCESKSCPNVGCSCTEAYAPGNTSGQCGGTGPDDEAVAACPVGASYTVVYC
ncbi:thaumatin [Rhodocollybia butyracea]|uniref:Thaumatin n=1 Tax=Rhodocollybia butyracea TaxID=206335 RepID=A0A9P5PYP9_9AGAR|nr:thaumatin [Rhodocollybia butyracea]